MKKVIALLLSCAIIMSLCVFAGADNKQVQNDIITQIVKKTECDDKCEKVPTVIVHGIGQSNVWLVDDDGNYVLDEDGNKIDIFPCYADTTKIIKRALFPLLGTLILQHDVGLSKCLEDVVDICFYMNAGNYNGTDSKYSLLEQYPYSLAECNEYEKEQIYNNVPLEGLGKDFEDHLYYFAYNSFGNNISTVDRLYKFIEQIKAETGHNKVNIVPISLGGTIANGLLEYYNGTYEGRPSVYDSIHKMIYIVPALDGSSIVGDVFTQNITFLDKEYLYNGFLETLMDKEGAGWVEIALRLLPNRVVMRLLNSTTQALVKNVFAKSTNMWALVPSADYDKAAKMWLDTDKYPEMAEIKKQADMYHTAQVNSDKNILALKNTYGAQIFNIVDYNYPMYSIGTSWDKENTDGIIDLDSTSMGCISANYGEKLPSGYVQSNINCNNPLHNHISPDNVVDASAGLLPDTTFYYANQSHEDTADNVHLMSLALELIKNDEIKDVYTDENYSQFCFITASDIPQVDDSEEPTSRKVSLWLLEHFATAGFTELFTSKLFGGNK